MFKYLKYFKVLSKWLQILWLPTSILRYFKVFLRYFKVWSKWLQILWAATKSLKRSRQSPAIRKFSCLAENLKIFIHFRVDSGLSAHIHKKKPLIQFSVAALTWSCKAFPKKIVCTHCVQIQAPVWMSLSSVFNFQQILLLWSYLPFSPLPDSSVSFQIA